MANQGGHSSGPMMGPPGMPGGPMGGPGGHYGGPPGHGGPPGYGGPMGGPPMGVPGMPPGVHGVQQGHPGMPPMGPAAGRSKALPIVVAAGLAIGVFGGLIIMNGTGGSKEEAVAAAVPDAGPPTAQADAQVEKTAAATSDAAVVAVAVDAAPAPPDAAAAKVAQADGNDTSATSGRRTSSTRRSSTSSSSRTSKSSGTRSSGGDSSDRPFRPEVFGDSSAGSVPQSATLTFDVVTGGAKDLQITVNGSRLSGTKHAMKLGGKAKRAKVVAKARGYKTWRRTLTVRKNQTIRIRLRRPAGQSQPGSLIDL